MLRLFNWRPSWRYLREAKGVASHSSPLFQVGKTWTRENVSRYSHVFAGKSITINGLVISSQPSHFTAINHLWIFVHRPAALFRKELQLTSILSRRNLKPSPRGIFGISELLCSITVTSIMIIIAVLTITACALLLYAEGAEWLPKQKCVNRVSPGRPPTLGAAPIISHFLIPSTVFCCGPICLSEAVSADVFFVTLMFNGHYASKTFTSTSKSRSPCFTCLETDESCYCTFVLSIQVKILRGLNTAQTTFQNKTKNVYLSLKELTTLHAQQHKTH